MTIISIFRCITCQQTIAQSEFGLTPEVYEIIKQHLEDNPTHELAQRFVKKEDSN